MLWPLPLAICLLVAGNTHLSSADSDSTSLIGSNAGVNLLVTNDQDGKITINGIVAKKKEVKLSLNEMGSIEQKAQYYDFGAVIRLISEKGAAFCEAVNAQCQNASNCSSGDHLGADGRNDTDGDIDLSCGIVFNVKVGMFPDYPEIFLTRNMLLPTISQTSPPTPTKKANATKSATTTTSSPLMEVMMINPLRAPNDLSFLENNDVQPLFYVMYCVEREQSCPAGAPTKECGQQSGIKVMTDVQGQNFLIATQHGTNLVVPISAERRCLVLAFGNGHHNSSAFGISPGMGTFALPSLNLSAAETSTYQSASGEIDLTAIGGGEKCRMNPTFDGSRLRSCYWKQSCLFSCPNLGGTMPVSCQTTITVGQTRQHENGTDYSSSEQESKTSKNTSEYTNEVHGDASASFLAFASVSAGYSHKWGYGYEDELSKSHQSGIVQKVLDSMSTTESHQVSYTLTSPPGVNQYLCQQVYVCDKQEIGTAFLEIVNDTGSDAAALDVGQPSALPSTPFPWLTVSLSAAATLLITLLLAAIAAFLFRDRLIRLLRKLSSAKGNLESGEENGSENGNALRPHGSTTGRGPIGGAKKLHSTQLKKPK